MAEDFPSPGARFRYDLRSATSLALDSIFAHKLRSFLTLLGVMIGVASVILVGAAIDGVGTYARATTEKAFGSETFILGQIMQVGQLNQKARFEKLKRNHQIKLADSRYLQSVNGDNAIYGAYRQSTTDLRRNNLTSEDASIQGASATIAEIRDVSIVEGRFFTQTEETSGAYVAVIGDDVRLSLFPGTGSPLGKTFKIQDLDFTVIGVQERVGSAFGQSQDNNAYIPITTFSRLFGPGNTINVFGRARPSSGLSMQQAVDLSRVAMRTRFHQKPGEADRFDFLTPDAIRGFIDGMLALVAAVVVPITLISLVVGGIVIMNIMLVSVTERTREIGIRKSLGARQSDIMRQILIEAVLMASTGGAAGVLIGLIATTVLTAALGVKLSISPFYVFLSVFVSGAVGVISGWYPASRAAKMDPIVALRAD
jgi:putative ABC transport system permease protein